MGVAHISVHMYSYNFKLSIFVCDLGDLDCIFGMDDGNIAGFVMRNAEVAQCKSGFRMILFYII